MSPSVTQKKINLKRIAHVYYEHKDLDVAKKFYLDFGFSVVDTLADRIYFRGYGTEPFTLCAVKADEDKFGGAGFVVDSLEDLEYAADVMPNATPIQDLKAPGGGKVVTFLEPVDNCPWHLVYGQTPVDMTETFPELSYNFPTQKHRPVNNYQRFRKGPAPVHKIGHYGLCVTDFDKAFDFYLKHFNFKPSELVHDPKTDKIVTTFVHLDRGMEQVDHHVFFFFEGPKFHVHHTSYEVHDFDIQSLGHQWLRDKGYKLVWGVGRHVMGSQIFDYWEDPSGFVMEHYVDGDLVDETTPVQDSIASPDSLHVWGPELPPTFLQ